MKVALRLLTSDPLTTPLVSSLLATFALIGVVLAGTLVLIARLTGNRLVVDRCSRSEPVRAG